MFEMYIDTGVRIAWQQDGPILTIEGHHIITHIYMYHAYKMKTPECRVVANLTISRGSKQPIDSNSQLWTVSYIHVYIIVLILLVYFVYYYAYLPFYCNIFAIIYLPLFCHDCSNLCLFTVILQHFIFQYSHLL